MTLCRSGWVVVRRIVVNSLIGQVAQHSTSSMRPSSIPGAVSVPTQRDSLSSTWKPACQIGRLTHPRHHSCPNLQQLRQLKSWAQASWIRRSNVRCRLFFEWWFSFHHPVLDYFSTGTFHQRMNILNRPASTASFWRFGQTTMSYVSSMFTFPFYFIIFG